MRRESRGFAIGATCFAVGALPGYLGVVGHTADNVTYFIGSIFFTGAAFIQLRLSGRWRSGAWSSPEAWDDWWSAAIQFIGTLAFNVSTGLAILGHLDADAVRELVWRPDFVGSICFLVSSGLAVRATMHAERLWDPDSRNWWTTWLNLIGSIAFMVSAIFAWIVPSTGEPVNTDLVNIGTFVGALGFLSAALLMRPESPGPSEPGQGSIGAGARLE